MNYKQKITDSQAKSYETVVATKIIDLMDKLRLSNDGTAERRWVWELLQNAKDVCYDNKQVSVEIIFDQKDETGTLEFKHNGKPFSIDNIIFLIEQISTKDRSEKNGEQPKETGKFGTGFLTTHLLSEKVEVSGIVTEMDLGPRKFDLELDRSGKTKDEIVFSVNKSMQSIYSLDSNPIVNYQPNDFNTTFRYHLDQKGIEVAKKGLTDLHSALPLTLAFLPTINSVKVQSNGETINYHRLDNIQKADNGIQLIKIEIVGHQTQIVTIALLTSQLTAIAIEVEEIKERIILKANKNIPHIFCDFPLLGTEEFHIPVVINNPSFHPNEPRSGIYLTDKNDYKIQTNKQIIQDALMLYNNLLDYASRNHWENLYMLAGVFVSEEKDWLSKEWFKNNLLKPIQDKLLVTPVVDTVNDGLITIDGNPQLFPFHKDETIRREIWELCSGVANYKLPIKKHIDAWYNIVKQGYATYRITLESITIWIEAQKDIHTLAKSLGKNEDETICWLNKYYLLINQDDNMLNLVNQDKYAVIPNQNNNFSIKSKLYIDLEIEEELKDALKLLAEDWRDQLIRKDVATGRIKYPLKNQKDIIDRINRLLNEKTEIVEACHYLISCFCDTPDFPLRREKIYNFCKAIFRDNIPEKHILQTWEEGIWKKVDEFEIDWLLDYIAGQKNIQTLMQSMGLSQEGILKWLHNFVSFLEKIGDGNKLNKFRILPNQKGDFKANDDLFLDGEIDSTLKDIAAELGHDFREELLDVQIFLQLPESRTKKNKEIAEKIRALIKSKFSEDPRSENTKRVFEKLFLWFNNNKVEAKELFESLYDNKHKLLNDEEIAQNMEAVPRLREENVELKNQIKQLTEENAQLKSQLNSKNQLLPQDVEQLKESKTQLEAENTELRDKIAELESNIELSIESPEITKEILTIYGIDSEEKLESFIQSKQLSIVGGHKGGDGFSMIMHVKEIIKRAKNNVKEYLMQKKDYDCSDWNEKDTVISGVKKSGKLIKLVVRPSDGNKVVFYDSSETQTLKLSSSELWVENGQSEPRQITLGIILEKTKIKQIQL